MTIATPNRRHLAFLFFLVLSLMAFHGPLHSLIRLSLADDRYSFNLAIPLLSVFLISLKGQALASGRYGLGAGVPLVLVGASIAVPAAAWRPSFDPVVSLSVMVLALVLVWIGLFIACYGTQAFVVFIFPLCFLLWTVPIPQIALDSLSGLLQAGSANAVYFLIKLTGVPVLRHGFTFTLPGLDIEIERQCSGMRAALALLITGSVAAYALLRSRWGRACWMLAIVPVAVVKNAMRIVTISYLGIYVNQDFLHGQLHRNGGLPFAIVAIVMLVPLLVLLRRVEARHAKKACTSVYAAAAR